ncbi:hypothetical protein PEX2_094200 [Penicillium expansum]|uniref:Uncharacterized protein n=1 Tax=Penicillium expansum TaxID=27334 RepID=A0A0A2K368_PENEN|nr:hypothetical protein PEX2_094200 [Penicillium expansum]KGO61363.1 hypothetical protein PEX2_094200 [Penicillium expansum]
MGLYRNSALSQLLPAKAEYEFLAREDIHALDQTMAKLSSLLLNALPEEKHEIQLKQKRAYNEKRSLYNEELRKVQAQSGKQHGSIYTETMFHYRRKVMPHRDFLARKLPYLRITENGYISTVATQGITEPRTGLQKYALNATYGLPMNRSGGLIARNILIIQAICSVVIRWYFGTHP